MTGDFSIENHAWACVESIGITGALSGPINVDFVGSFFVGQDGEGRFILRLPADHDTLDFAMTEDGNERFVIRGTLEDDRTIEADEVMLIGSNNTLTVGSPAESVWKLVGVNNITIRNPEIDNDFPLSIIFEIANFDFSGVDFSEVQTEKGPRRIRDKFTFQAYGLTWTVKQVQAYKERIDSLKNKRVTQCVTAEISVTVETEEQKTTAIERIDDICWLFSLTSATLVSRLSTKLCQGTDVGEAVYRNTIKSHFVPFGRFIDNFRIQGGLIDFIQQSSDAYLDNRDTLELRKYIHMILLSWQELPVEMKVMAIILSLEMITTTHAKVVDGLTDERLETMNVQSKLGRLNAHLRFIPARMTDDWLRRDVRNPLVHTGVVTTYNPQQLIQIYFELVNLSLQIFFRLVDYTGDYFDPSNNFEPTPVP